jgi:hypothetical protein
MSRRKLTRHLSLEIDLDIETTLDHTPAIVGGPPDGWAPEESECDDVVTAATVNGEEPPEEIRKALYQWLSRFVPDPDPEDFEEEERDWDRVRDERRDDGYGS